MKKTINEALIKLNKYHKDYIQMAKAIAGNNQEVANYAEDFVQNAYIRLSKYDNLYEKVVKNGKVQKGYMFFVLRSIILNSIKKKSNLKYNHLGYNYDFEEKFNLVETEIEPEVLGANLIEEKMYKVLKDNADWFDYQLFRTYLESGKSFRALSEESGIGVRTIYLSIKRSKLLIAELLFEDYQDYINGDFDKI